MGLSSVDATKALLMRMARAEGCRLRRGVSLERFPFRVDFAEEADVFARVAAVFAELDLEAACLFEPGAVESAVCAEAKKTSSHAARAAWKMRARRSVEKRDQKHFIRPL